MRRILEQETPKSDHKAFRLVPTEIYRVDAKSGAEELVRGVEVVGTALIAMGRLKATGDQPFALNTLCDYGSGNQAVSVMGEMTAHNAHIVEQASADAAQLQERAGALGQAVAAFVLQQDGRPMGRALALR